MWFCCTLFFFSFINCVICVMFCSINFHEHCLLLLVFFLVFCECYNIDVCHALWALDLLLTSIEYVRCFVSIVSLQRFKVWCWWYVCYFMNIGYAWPMFCEHYNFGDLFGTYFVMFLEHSWTSPTITWGLHCKFGKQCFWWFIYSFVLIS